MSYMYNQGRLQRADYWQISQTLKEVLSLAEISTQILEANFKGAQCKRAG